ncbi:MAG: hypothetical protein ACYC35_16540 [Pirellulales bacterium]
MVVRLGLIVVAPIVVVSALAVAGDAPRGTASASDDEVRRQQQGEDLDARRQAAQAASKEREPCTDPDGVAIHRLSMKATFRPMPMGGTGDGLGVKAAIPAQHTLRDDNNEEKGTARSRCEAPLLKQMTVREAASQSLEQIERKKPTAATLEQWLEGKEVVEVCFAGPHIEPLKLRDSLHTKVSDRNWDFRLTPGEGGGHGSFIQVVMRVTRENTQRLMDLQSELTPRQYILCQDHTRVWSTMGDPAIRAQARKLVPEVLAAFEKTLAKNAANAKFTPITPSDASKLGGFRYDLGEPNTGSVRIVEITPLKTWETAVAPDQFIHFPQLGLMVTVHYRSGSLLDRKKVSPSHLAIRKAFCDVVEPLLKLEPGVKVQTSF